MIISIAGFPCSGKTTTGKLLAQKLGYHFVSMGDIRGEIAASKGLTINQLNEIGEKEDWTDREIDKRVEELGKRENLIIDSRTAFHFIPHSVKVLLKVDLDEAARRFMKDKRIDEHYSSLEEAKQAFTKRIESDKKRYKKYYGFDCTDQSHYDVVIDTTNTPPEEVAEMVLEHVEKK